MGRPVSTLKREYRTPAQALGAVITELRIEKDLGYEEVSQRVGCNAGYMNGIEHGKHNPSLNLLQAIADFHKIPLWKMIQAADRRYQRRRRSKPKQ